jgi:hypothetical protein
MTNPRHLQYVTFQCYTSEDYESKFKDLTNGKKPAKGRAARNQNDSQLSEDGKEEDNGEGEDSDQSEDSEYQENVVHEIPAWMQDEKIQEVTDINNFIISKN